MVITALIAMFTKELIEATFCSLSLTWRHLPWNAGPAAQKQQPRGLSCRRQHLPPSAARAPAPHGAAGAVSALGWFLFGPPPSPTFFLGL